MIFIPKLITFEGYPKWGKTQNCNNYTFEKETNIYKLKSLSIYLSTPNIKQSRYIPNIYINAYIINPVNLSLVWVSSKELYRIMAKKYLHPFHHTNRMSLSSLGVPGMNSTNPRPPNTGRMNALSNFLQK